MKSKKSGFSLIEISLVILAVGIIIAAITMGSRMVQDSRLSSARQLTLTSPVKDIEGLILWLEPTSPFSFATGTTTFTDVELPANGTLIGRWNDMKPNSPIKTSLTASATVNDPTYTANCINNLPCLRFDGGDYLWNLNILLNSAQATIFVVAKRFAAVAEVSTISLVHTTVWNDYDNPSSFVAFYEGPSATMLQTYRNGALSTATHPGTNVPYIASSTFNGATNVVHLNGTAQSAVASTGSFYATKFIMACRYVNNGLTACYNGYIAEAILFNRVLKIDERKSIEKYLSKKWGITVS